MTPAAESGANDYASKLLWLLKELHSAWLSWHPFIVTDVALSLACIVRYYFIFFSLLLEYLFYVVVE